MGPNQSLSHAIRSAATHDQNRSLLRLLTSRDLPPFPLNLGGKEMDDSDRLDATGLKDNSRVLILETQASKDRKLELSTKAEEISKASQAVAAVRAEVDKLSLRVTALEEAVRGGTKVSDKEFEISTELLMRQLLKLDSIEAEAEARALRKAEVCRVQGLVDNVDSLKAQNSQSL